MQQFSGLLSLLLGIALGGFAFLTYQADAPYQPADAALGPRHAASAAVVAAEPGARIAPADASAARVFSTAAPVFRNVTPIESEVIAEPAAAKTVPWTTIVPSDRPTILAGSSPDDETPYALARDLQVALKRAGCYAGEVTGVWSPATRYAMSDFMDRANATLPVDKPDYVLLALVQSHADISCTAECSTGEVMTSGGRCLPKAVVAQAEKKAKRVEERRLAETRLDGGRRLAAGESDKLPWLQGASQVAAVEPAAASPPALVTPHADLPGKMSIGGPVDAVAPNAPPAQVAALAPSEGQQGEAVDATKPDDPDAAPATAPVTASPPPESIPLPDEQAQQRPRLDSYAYSGKRRRSDPRPGTMRFNLVQSLGGIY